ncbi:hypothetical protein [Vibrio phage phiKT1024]|nr:hypothetical protein [Vibrio phage phiKT1024]
MSLNKKSQEEFKQCRKELLNKIYTIQSNLGSASLIFDTLELNGKPVKTLKFKRDFFEAELKRHEKQLQDLIDNNPEWLI